jgi:hypothetical protein
VEVEGALPLSAAYDVNAGEPNAKGGVRSHTDEAREKTHKWVAGRSERVAALHCSGVALADRDRRKVRRREATVTPGHWDDSSGDATRHSEGCNQRDEGLVEHHCEDYMEAVVILELSFGLGNSKLMRRPFIDFPPCPTGQCQQSHPHSLPSK